MTKFLAIVGGCGIGVVIGVVFGGVAAIINGWVLSLLWLWFIVGIFGLPALSIPQAIGISLIVGFLTPQAISSTKLPKKEDGTTDYVPAITALLRPFIMLLWGWFVYTYFLVH
jgi:hypothetical protein